MSITFCRLTIYFMLDKINSTQVTAEKLLTSMWIYVNLLVIYSKFILLAVHDPVPPPTPVIKTPTPPPPPITPSPPQPPPVTPPPISPPPPVTPPITPPPPPPPVTPPPVTPPPPVVPPVPQ